MLLCRGLILLTAVNIQPRFRLVNRTVSSHEPARAFTRSALVVHACQCAEFMDSGGTVGYLILLYSLYY